MREFIKHLSDYFEIIPLYKRSSGWWDPSGLISGYSLFDDSVYDFTTVKSSKNFRALVKSCNGVFVEGIRSDSVLALTVFSRMLGKPTILKDQGARYHGFSTLIRPELFCSALVLQTPFELRFYSSDKINKVILGNGVDTKVFSPATRSRRSHFLFVGRITAHKGLEYLVRALPSDSRLVMAGPISDLTYFKYLTTLRKWEQVSYVGQVTRTDLVSLYQHALALVLPSVTIDHYGKHHDRPELFGLVSLEARSCGAPCVVSNVGGLPYTVEDGRDGFVIPERNINKLQITLERLQQDESLVMSMGREAHDIILKGEALGTSYENYASRLLHLIEETIV